MDDDRATSMNGSQDEDEALRIAIAMSLGERPPPKAVAENESPVIDLTQDDQEHGTDAYGTRHAEDPSTKTTQHEDGFAPMLATASVNSFSVLGINRKKMEEERLLRAKKRKAAQDDDLLQERSIQRMKADPPGTDPFTPSITSEHKYSTMPSTSRFPQGIVRKTWARGYPRLGDDITIEEVLQKDQLELAVLSSFQWDEKWLLSKIDLARTKLVLISFAVDEAQKEEMRQNVPRDKVRFCFPPMAGPGSMHSKLQLLKYSAHLRIVVPTGNLVPYDWGETRVLENMVFLIDIPKIEDPANRVSNKLTPFAEELIYFLQAQGMDDKLVQSLKSYDFSETARYGFVHSIAGSHRGEAWRRTGYCGLGRCVSSLFSGIKSDPKIDFVTASLGSVSYDLLEAIYNACKGDDGMKEYKARLTRPKSSGDSSSLEQRRAILKESLRVYFPSHDTVQKSRGGPHSAGTICFRARWWNLPSFPREVLCDSISKRKGILMHSKIIFVRFVDSGALKGFAYLGSANLSESAWGRLVKERGTGKPKMTCRNWECGVLIPGSTINGGSATTDSSSTDAWRVFDDRVPVPMEVPGIPYASAGTGHPWFYQGD
ncbi:hypothetical protein VTK73DRAFT_9775 [Phialemonium thermophilum]|uniref:PLD phosphodiesterase domain-containing protein n=1 Tax=Phialemonium thermophilum TaxID=223376 RepID=A0ABR3XIY5_9PEZI